MTRKKRREVENLFRLDGTYGASLPSSIFGRLSEMTGHLIPGEGP